MLLHSEQKCLNADWLTFDYKTGMKYSQKYYTSIRGVDKHLVNLLSLAKILRTQSTYLNVLLSLESTLWANTTSTLQLWCDWECQLPSNVTHLLFVTRGHYYIGAWLEI